MTLTRDGERAKTGCVNESFLVEEPELGRNWPAKEEWSIPWEGLEYAKSLSLKMWVAGGSVCLQGAKGDKK